jgi:hypothetical protein
MYYMFCYGMLELAKIWNLGLLAMLLSIHKVRFSKKLLIWSLGKPVT